jgi:uncharacterized protein (TIGR03083 family)
LSKELERILDRLHDEGAKAASFFADLPEASWRQQVYIAGSGWTVREVLAHFVSAERTFIHYLRQALTDGPGVDRDFDIDAFNEHQVESLRGERLAALLDAFRQARAEMTSLVGTLTAADLERPGYHPWFGETVFKDMIQLVYRHNMIHLRDIRRALARGEPLPTAH